MMNLRLRRQSLCLALLTLTLCLTLPANAEQALKLHSIFSSNMVIQRDKPIKVWGWAQPGAQVMVGLFRSNAQASVSPASIKKDGRWEITFKALEASAEPHTLLVTAGGESVDYTNIVIGDVWVMNGQSNMAWGLNSTLDVGLRALQADLPQLRLMKIMPNEQSELAADIPEEKIATDGGWVVSDPETARGVSGIGVAFGVNLQRSLNIPIGIIDNARGGASIESLVPERKLDEHPLTKRYYEYVKQREAEFSIDDWLAKQTEKWQKKVESEKKKGTPDNKLPNKPTKDDIRSWSIPGMSPSDAGACYNGMFGAFIGYNIKGVLFHQGFNNALGNNCRPRRYRIITQLMVEGWREDFNDPQLPVGVIGFCAGGTPQNAYNFEALSRSNGSYIREAQRLGLADVGDPQYTAFLPSFDVQIPGLHPKKKYEHGERAARWALSRVYEKDVPWDHASLIKSEVVGDQIVLTFDKKVYPHDMGAIPEGFSIAGEDGNFYKAYARFRTDKPQAATVDAGKYDTTTIHVWSPLVEKPVAVRYGWSVSPLSNLYVDGKPWAPLHSFRTDTWDLPEDEDPSVPGMPGTNYRAENQQNAERNAERLAKEAEMAVQINERLKTLGVVVVAKE